MRLIVTGREGQIVRSIIERAKLRPGVEVVALGRPGLDLEMPDTIGPALEAARPDIVVSAAAYTAVDQAEHEPQRAFAINTAGPGYLAETTAKMGVPLIHLSTDYVFDGEKSEPYTEQDAAGPRNVYGASKLAGEEAVAAANPRHLILRTAWVYSPFGKNFVKTMLKLASEREAVSVVSDQWGCPTSALDIADGILHAATMLRTNKDFASFGTYHLAGTGETNWSGFARHIFATSRKLGGPHAEVHDIATVDYPVKTFRPSNSRLSTAKFTATFGWTAADWRQSSEVVVSRLLTSS